MGNWLFMVVLGVLSAAAGLLALFYPFPASLAVLKFVGIAFLIIGAGEIFEAIRAEGWGGKIWALLLGIIAVLVGINLLARPLEGLITLSFVLAAMFIASGVFKLAVGWRIHMAQLRFAVIISGLASLLIGLVIFANFPASAATSLGILLGIELLSNGISAIAMGYSRKAGGVMARA
jgi:uncharacterized membrane protein HdeD (DUF308 family)